MMVSPGVSDDLILAFDYGERRIGIALGNRLTRTPSPLRIIERHVSQPMERSWQAIGAVLNEWKPGCVVVGVPRHPDGSAHTMTQRCERFARQMHGRFGLPVHLVDERYSSAVLTPDQAGDDAAAAVILQQWFHENEVKSC
jgi:putative Holliday junction resolvase